MGGAAPSTGNEGRGNKCANPPVGVFLTHSSAPLPRHNDGNVDEKACKRCGVVFVPPHLPPVHADDDPGGQVFNILLVNLPVKHYSLNSLLPSFSCLISG